MRSIRWTCGLVEQHSKRRRKERRHGCFVPGCLIEKIARAETREERDRTTGYDTWPKSVAMRSRMVKREGKQVVIITTETRGRTENFTAINKAGIGQDHSLRKRSGSGRVE